LAVPRRGAGRILFVGTLVDRQSPSIRQPRRRMPIVSQRFNLFPHRTALEYVTEAPIHVHGGSPSERPDIICKFRYSQTCRSISERSSTNTVDIGPDEYRY
jgi:ABC-type polar amino acid transport system ATPase subunit